MNRFERQINLTGFGEESQKKLSQTSVLVVGAGGLGCPVLLYLAAAGLGKIAVIDGDKVAASNLNRQVIFGEQDIGKSKAEVVGSYLRRKYGDIQVEDLNYFMTTENALSLIGQYDIIIDGTDNFNTRYLVNDACVLLDKPLVFGAIFKNEGQMAVFNLPDKDGIKINYRDIFPEQPSADSIPNCSETGVLGVLPGMIGVLMATQAIKLASGFGEISTHKMILYNQLYLSFYEIEIKPDERGRALLPNNEMAFRKMNYKVSCSSNFEINWKEVVSAVSEAQGETVLVDIRDEDELPKLKEMEHLKIPAHQLANAHESLKPFKKIVLFCQKGIRSRYAASLLQSILTESEIYSVEGGLNRFYADEKGVKNVRTNG